MWNCQATTLREAACSVCWDMHMDENERAAQRTPAVDPFLPGGVQLQTLFNDYLLSFSIYRVWCDFQPSSCLCATTALS